MFETLKQFSRNRQEAELSIFDCVYYIHDETIIQEKVEQRTSTVMSLMLAEAIIYRGLGRSSFKINYLLKLPKAPYVGTSIFDLYNLSHRLF